ncbi:TPA: hypothetical protein N0F65_011260 [Lagenidium giganteum]|uniref:Uncharacterized protein n=1 Tax=Lagenidium giganteum TaxID=4803 RepID=A0AAV2YVR7_9STRA|nr:TPA: hypothetical protein N0F65_011260 [Lagenidium giganteum]
MMELNSAWWHDRLAHYPPYALNMVKICLFRIY